MQRLTIQVARVPVRVMRQLRVAAAVDMLAVVVADMPVAVVVNMPAVVDIGNHRCCVRQRVMQEAAGLDGSAALRVQDHLALLVLS